MSSVRLRLREEEAEEKEEKMPDRAERAERAEPMGCRVMSVF